MNELRENKLIQRNTRQRKSILEMLKSTKEHPTAEIIYFKVRKELPNISLGTIYRNLNILKQEGIIKEIKTTGKKTHYDADVSFHSHFICQHCDVVSDFEVKLPLNIFNDIKEKISGKLLNQEIYLYGICLNCIKK